MRPGGLLSNRSAPVHVMLQWPGCGIHGYKTFVVCNLRLSEGARWACCFVLNRRLGSLLTRLCA